MANNRIRLLPLLRIPIIGHSQIGLFKIFIILNLVSLIQTSTAYNEYSIVSPHPLNFINCEGNSWIQDFKDGYPDSPSIRSGPIRNGGMSSICMNITGPTSITFWWKKNISSNNLGELDFLVDNESKFECNSFDWTYASFTLNDNKNHTIKWQFRKFRSYPEYTGYGMLDDLCFSNYAQRNEAEKRTNISANISKVSQYIGQADFTLDIKRLNLNQGYILQNLSQIKASQKSIRSFLKVNETTYVNGYFNDYYSYPTINEAIQHVLPGGTVRVFPGIYQGPIYIDRPLNLIGFDKNNTEIYAKNSVAIYINSSNVSIQCLTLKEGIKGIKAELASNCIIRNNNILNCDRGIVLGNNSNLTIVSNIIGNPRLGIQLDRTSDSYLIDNTIFNVIEHAIHLYNSKNNIIKGNLINNTDTGIIFEERSINNTIIETNFINNSWDICFKSQNLLNENTIPDCCINKDGPKCLPNDTYLCKSNCSNCDSMRGSSL